MSSSIDKTNNNSNAIERAASTPFIFEESSLGGKFTYGEVEYLTADAEKDSAFRPYSGGLSPINSGIATMVLVKNGTVTKGDSGGARQIRGGLIPVLPEIASDFIGVFKNFSLTQYSDVRQEALNIQRTFGREWVAFFFGEQPRSYQFSGHFLDYEEYPYYEQFMKAYDLYLRGTKCLENKMSLYISYDGRLIRGLMTSISTSKISAPGAPPGVVSFTFSLLIMGDQWIRNSYKRLSNAAALGTLFTPPILYDGVNATEEARV